MRGARFMALACGLTVAGCGAGDPSGPPELRLGRDECAECGMLLSDEASACALLVGPAGAREHRVFDDIGCLLDFERKQRPEVAGRFVHDLAGGGWIDGTTAVYLVADPAKVRTPMGSGIAAFATGEAAVKRADQLGGSTCGIGALAEKRKAGAAGR